MRLSKQVSNLKSSKRLKELGVKQRSLWYWVREFDKRKCKETDVWVVRLGLEGININRREYYSAFTVAELGEMLPEGFWYKPSMAEVKGFFTPKFFKYAYSFEVYYESKSFNPVVILNNFSDKSEVTVRAKMLIHLIENKLIKV